MSKFTPGPWKLIVSDDIWPTVAIVGADGYPIFSVECADKKTLANARLIAAAPDMLAALKYWFDSKADPKRLAEMARAAIAKAEGK